MIATMWVLSVLAFVWGLVIFGAAKGGIHEVYATLAWVLSAVLFVGAMLLATLQRIEARLAEAAAGAAPRVTD